MISPNTEQWIKELFNASSHAVASGVGSRDFLSQAQRAYSITSSEPYRLQQVVYRHGRLVKVLIGVALILIYLLIVWTIHHKRASSKRK